ncbi:tetratricopeptide repeat protein [bacterium]|nr:tetratricopeptide repeat protein [bacterium]
MNLIKNYFFVVFVFAAISVFAQTSIPDSPEGRIAKVKELEKSIKTSKSPEILRELGMIYSVIAGTDNVEKETVHKAEKTLDKATQANPQDYELMAAHGSVLTMMAKFEIETSKQLRFVKSGTRKLDRALKKDPDNIGALLQRGGNSLGLPVFLKRTHFAKKDYQHVLDLVGDKQGPDFKAMVLFNLGRTHELLEEPEKAKEYWQKAKELNAPYWSKKAADKL